MEGFAFKRDAGLSWAQSGVTVRGSMDSVDPIEFDVVPPHYDPHTMRRRTSKHEARPNVIGTFHQSLNSKQISAHHVSYYVELGKKAR